MTKLEKQYCDAAATPTTIFVGNFTGKVFGYQRQFSAYVQDRI